MEDDRGIYEYLFKQLISIERAMLETSVLIAALWVAWMILQSMFVLDGMWYMLVGATLTVGLINLLSKLGGESYDS